MNQALQEQLAGAVALCVFLWNLFVMLQILFAPKLYLLSWATGILK